MEYKFRGQRVDNKEWIYGSLDLSNWHTGDVSDLDYKYPIIILHDKSQFLSKYVFPETVGQYTGLKDKNGKEIYCGDICSMSKKIDMKIIVDYKDAGFGWSDKYNNLAFRGHGYLTEILKAIEVIGNKFDNPELLEEK